MAMIALAGLLLSSCTMRAVVAVDVNPDGSGVFDVTVALDEELRTLLEEESSDPIDWTDPSSFEGTDSPADFFDELPEGSTVEPYTEEDFEGFTVTAEFSSLAELEEILAGASTEDEEAFPLSIVSVDGERFELTTQGDLFGDTQLAEEEAEFLPASVLANLFDFQLRVHLPGDIVSTNADETTEDGVMVWSLDVTSEDPVEPEAISEIGSSFPWVIVLLAVLVLAAVVAGLVFMRNRPEPVAAAPEAEPETAPES